MKTPLRFAKIISASAVHAWAQAYTAGNLIAVISLTQGAQNAEAGITEISLPILGKDLINTLESEYFTLETKNLTTIKQAISTTIEKVPQDLLLSFGVAVIIENILYLYLYGPGKIIMKRDSKTGTLLEQVEEKNLIAGSGFIVDGDVILLETKEFVEAISLDVIAPFLQKDKLSDMSDSLSPIIHEKQVGGAAAIAFSYTEEGATSKHTEKTVIENPLIASANIPSSPEALSSNEVVRENENAQIDIDTSPSLEKQKTHFLPSFQLSHARKLFITIVIIVLIVLIGSIVFSNRKHQQVADQKLFQQTVLPAQKKYDEAQSLLDLNKNLALEDYQNAKSLLNPSIGKFPPGTKENQTANALMQKIDSALTVLSQTATQDAKITDVTNSPLLAALLQHTNAKYATQDDKTVYLADNSSVTAINKSDAKEKTIIQNNSDWKDIGGFETYLGNFYLLDKNAGILKYVDSDNNYTKSLYFSGTTPDLSKANGIAIDGSIWVLFSNGSIAKYTRGKADSFTLQGLDKPLANPSRIYTSVDINNLYILDNGNKRIVILNKNGTFVAQYPAGIIGNAQDFQVFESQKKIYVLSAGKVWEIDIK